MICSRQCCASWSRWDTIEKDQILNLAQGPITEWYIWAASWIHVAGTEVAHVDELSWRQSTVRLLQTQHMALSKASGGPPDRHGRKCMVLKLHIDFSLDIVWSRVLGPAFLAKAARWWRGRCGRCIVGWWWCDKSELPLLPGILVEWLQGSRVGIIDRIQIGWRIFKNT